MKENNKGKEILKLLQEKYEINTAQDLSSALKDMFKGAYVVFLILGTVANYVVGVVMFCFLTSSNLATGISACVLPFIPTAIIKAVLASYL